MTKPDKKICTECKKELTTSSNFYNSQSPVFTDGKAPICKSCINKKVDYGNMQTIYSLLQSMDIAFLYEYWDRASQKNPTSAFGNYIRQANSLNQFKGLGWKDSVFDSSLNNSNTKDSKSKSSCKIDTRESRNNEDTAYNNDWRGTYAASDLEYLEDYYKDLNTDFKIITRNHKDYARKIAKASLAMDRAYDDMINGVQGSDTRYKNLKDTFDTLSKSAQFAEDKRGINDVGLGGFGVVFDKVEAKQWIPQHVPLEKDDFDKLIDYFSTIERSL